MSMSSDMYHGYGFRFTCDEECVAEFIVLHRETFCQLEDGPKLYKEVEAKRQEHNLDLEEVFTNYGTSVGGYGCAVADIMTEETGIRFNYCPSDTNCGTDASIIFEQTYPWLLNDKEKNISEEELRCICRKFQTELGIEEDPDYLSLEYYG